MTKAPAHRSPRQRAVAARYDGVHALLVRIVHPLCFATFALTVAAVAGGIAYALLSGAIGDDGTMLMVVAVFALVALAAAFLFVLTPARAVIGLLVLGGWGLALALVEVDPGALWAITGVACISVVVQLALLARVTPARWRSRLLHLLLPATVGTIIGIAPVALVAVLLQRGEDDLARSVLVAACAAGCAVLLVLLVLHRYGNAGDRAILEEFAAAHGLATRGSSDTVPAGIAPLVPKFANQPEHHTGTIDSRTVSVATGYTATAQADLPSLHLTALSIQLAGTPGHDVWIRRRSWTHDNVLASLGRSEVVRFEPIRLSERYDIHVPAGTDHLELYTEFDPVVVELLDRDLGEAQACRIGTSLILFVVGGVLDRAELDSLLATGLQLAAQLEAPPAVAS